MFKELEGQRAPAPRVLRRVSNKLRTQAGNRRPAITREPVTLRAPAVVSQADLEMCAPRSIPSQTLPPEVIVMPQSPVVLDVSGFSLFEAAPEPRRIPSPVPDDPPDMRETPPVEPQVPVERLADEPKPVPSNLARVFGSLQQMLDDDSQLLSKCEPERWSPPVPYGEESDLAPDGDIGFDSYRVSA
jgi:hypothetical protein